MNSNSTQQFINVKVYFDNLPDIRRLRLATSNLKLENLKNQVVPSDNFNVRIAYKDSEGDWVNIQSDDELHDAVYFYKDASDPVLRIKFFRCANYPNSSSTSSNREDSNPFGANFSGDLQKSVENIVTNLQNVATQNPIISEFINNFNKAMEHQQEGQQQSRQEPPTPPTPPPPYPGENRLNNRCHRRRRRIFHPPFQCDKAAYRGYPLFSGRHLASSLIHKAVEYMNEGNLNAAESELMKAKELNVNAELVNYNLACIQSLRGNLEEAVEHLKKAVEHGYNNTDWMLKDPDLANIRKLRAFHELIASIGASKNQTPHHQCSAIQTVPQATKSEPSKQQETQQSNNQIPEDKTLEETWNTFQTSDQSQLNNNTNNNNNDDNNEQKEKQPEKWADQLQMLHEMGLTNDDLNRRLLDRWNGNLARVINESLSQK